MPDDIIDNRTKKLAQYVNQFLAQSQRASFALGYFFLSGFDCIKGRLAVLPELRLLIGDTTSRETIEQLMEGYHRLDLLERDVERMRYANRNQQESATAGTAVALRDALAVMDQTDTVQELVVTLARLIEEGRIRVKVYTKGRMHAKAYIFDYLPGTYEEGIAIVGSSNLSVSGISHNTELNVVVPGNENHNRLNAWFDELWDEASDFHEGILTELSKSWPLFQPTPYDIYIKTLYNLVKDRLEDAEEPEPVWSGDIPLADFQRDAMKRAIQILDRYGGVFVADVAGLGKTFVGGALLKHYYQTHRRRPLVVAPASLVRGNDGRGSMWESFTERYDVNARLLSMGELREHGVDLDSEVYEYRDMVLVDESHNFRHEDTQRYKALEAYVRSGNRPVILMTATPQNNTPWDVYYQIKLFHQEDRTSIPIEPPNLREFFRQVDDGHRQLPELLRQIMVRTTRSFVKKYYPNAQINGKAVRFPERKLQTVRYSIENTYPDVYQQVFDLLKQLKYAKYGLWNYVMASKRSAQPYVGLVGSAGQNLRGIMRILLFKRFESSVRAFCLSVERMARVHEAFLRSLEAGIVAAGEEANDILYETARDEELDAADILERLQRASNRYRIEDFNADALAADVAHDRDLLREILSLVSPIGPGEDDKLRTFRQLLAQEPLAASKVLVFSQFAETIDYLYENLKDLSGVERVHSKTDNLASAVNRFAPKANNARPEHARNPIRLLLATDVLSEGHNLQDGAIVVNYDLHWNPVRLIQRVGRVDRVTTEAAEILVYNFLPETELEKQLGLHQKLARRIQEIHDAIGEDSPILDQSERLNEEAMYAIYEGQEGVLDAPEDEGDIYSEAEAILRQLEREQPEYMTYIRNMPDGMRSARTAAGAKGYFVFCRADDYQRLYLVDEGGAIVSTNPMETVRKLACSPTEPSQDIPTNHNQIVGKVMTEFRREVKEREASLHHRLRHTLGQRYVLDELRLAYGATRDENERARISFLQDAFSISLPGALNRELNRLRRSKVTGDQLVVRLAELHRQYDLGAIRDRQRAGQPSRSVPRVVCSEALL